MPKLGDSLLCRVSVCACFSVPSREVTLARFILFFFEDSNRGDMDGWATLTNEQYQSVAVLGFQVGPVNYYYWSFWRIDCMIPSSACRMCNYPRSAGSADLGRCCYENCRVAIVAELSWMALRLRGSISVWTLTNDYWWCLSNIHKYHWPDEGLVAIVSFISNWTLHRLSLVIRCPGQLFAVKRDADTQFLILEHELLCP